MESHSGEWKLQGRLSVGKSPRWVGGAGHGAQEAKFALNKSKDTPSFSE